MPKPSTYTMPLASIAVTERMEEVRFWLIMRQIQKTYDENIYTNGIIENIAMLSGCRLSVIMSAFNNLRTAAFKPSTSELAAATKYLDIDIRTMRKVANMSNKTIYDGLNEFLREEQFDMLKPRLSGDSIAEVIKFNVGVKKVFQHFSALVGNLND